MPRKNENICSQRLLERCSQSIIYNSLKWKQPKCKSADEWVNTNVMYLYTGILFSHKDRRPNMDKLWKHDAEWKTPGTEVHTLLGLHLQEMSRMGGDVETESRAVVARGQGWGRLIRGTDNGRGICWNQIEVVAAGHCDELSIIELHALNWFVLCEFHLNPKKIFLKKRWRGHTESMCSNRHSGNRSHNGQFLPRQWWKQPLLV